MIGFLYLEVVGKVQLHDVKAVTVLGEDWLDRVPHCAVLGHRHDLVDLVGEAHFEDVALVSLEDVEVL